MTSLSDVPMDVIQYVLYPMLDIQSRLLANDIFYPSRVIEKRIATRISIEHKIAHAILIESSILISYLHKISRHSQCSCTHFRICECDLQRPIQKNHYQNIIILFRKILHGGADMCIQYNKNFRTILINKCIIYTNPLNRQYIEANFTTGYKKGLMRLCERIIEKLDTLPFVRNVRSQKYIKEVP